MANSLNIELTDKVVVLNEEIFKPEFTALKFRLFKVSGGFGASPETIGRKIFGKFLSDGEECGYSGYDVERLATEEEIKSVNG
jgi:hypothetical protein